MARPFKVESVHKQMYPATYNFKDDADGDEPSGWTTSNGAGCTTVVIASFDGHRKVLELADTNGATLCNIMLDFGDPLADDVHEFWFAVSTIGANASFRINFYEGATRLFFIRNITDDLQYYDGGFKVLKANYVVANTFIHIKVVPDDSANTMDIYVDGVKELTGGSYENNSTVGIEKISITSVNATVATCYIDAWGSPTRDTDYAIGDNVFWRHYFDQDSDFESEDVGTTEASIDFIDWSGAAANTEVSIVNFFDEHKKVLSMYDNNGAAMVNCRHDISIQTSGTIELWIKTTDASLTLRVNFAMAGFTAMDFRIDNEKWQYYHTAAWNDASSGTPLDDTWYHIKIIFDCTPKTYDFYVDNILIDSAIPFNSAATSIIYMYMQTINGDSGYTGYIDAVSISGTSGNEVADNRTFDYNSTYTKTDITTYVKNVLYKNEIYKWREGTLISEKSYENSEVFFQVYDVNSKLAMEAEIKSRNQIEKDYYYPLRDKNQDDLEHRSSNVFTADDIHDPTDSTSMLKVILPNVSQADGDLILVNADTKTDTYSPTTQNYPDYMMLRDISDLADSIVIVDANGKCYLDDDKASGTTLDLDTAADKDNMTGPPLVTDILEDVNYFEIFGAMNPETGARFYKIIDNTGDDKKRSWRYTNNAFQSQADVDAYAAKLNTRSTTIKIIKFTAQSIGTHNMGETINYDFVDALYNIPQANYYVIYEEIDFDANESTIILSEGMIEESKYAATYELPENYNDSYASEIYGTDTTTIGLSIYPDTVTGASWGQYGVLMTNVGETVRAEFFTSEKVDTTRAATISFVLLSGLNGNHTCDGEIRIVEYATDGSRDNTVVANNLNLDFIFTEDLGRRHMHWDISATQLEPNMAYQIYWESQEAGDYFMTAIQVEYYVKRPL